MKRILIVESDMDYAIKTGIYWGRKGFAPTFAFSIREAMAEIRSQKPELILVNQRLRDGCGIEFLKRMRSSGYNVPTVIRVEIEDGIVNEYNLVDKNGRFYNKRFSGDEITEKLNNILQLVG